MWREPEQTDAAPAKWELTAVNQSFHVHYCG